MRIVVVWITAFILLFVFTVSWYATVPAVIGVSRGLSDSYSENPNAANIGTAVEYVGYAWGPLLDIFILVWAVISSQKRDVESEIYG